MSLRPRIAILSANYGTGHFIAAKSLKHLFEDSTDTLLLDIVEHGSPVEKSSAKLHIWIWRYFPLIWRKIYYNSHSEKLKILLKNLLNIKIYKIIRDYNPEIIISTNPYATFYGEKYKLENPSTKLFVVVTDYVVHPLWISDKVDLYFLPSVFTLKSFSLSNYVISGIPLRKGFWFEIDKKDIRKELGIKTDKLVALIVGNSIFNPGEIIRYINTFRNDLYFIIIVGKDTRRFYRVSSALKKDLNFKVYRYVEDIHKLFFACDFSITKAGGLTLSELIWTKTPAIYYKSLPGQEEGNEAFIREYRLGFIAKNFGQLISSTRLIIKNPYILKYFSNNLRVQKENMNFFRIKDIVLGEVEKEFYLPSIYSFA